MSEQAGASQEGAPDALGRSPKEAAPVKPVLSPEPIAPASGVGLADVQGHEGVQTFIELADRYLGELGYTEHGFRHAGLVSRIAYNVLHRLDYDEHMTQLGSIAGYLHDMGNFVSRTMHSQTGAAITYDILRDLGMNFGEMTSARGPSAISAAGSKASLRMTRTRSPARRSICWTRL